MANDIATKHGSVYTLGHHDAERQRLTSQHESLIALMGTPPLSPIDDSKVKKIVDIGCGVNASMSLIFAKRFPNAQVYGVDLSPVKVDNQPSNLEFIEGNILHLLGKDSRLAEGTVDLVFSRLLISGMQDWRGHILAVSKLLSPGGWLEMQDIADWQFFHNDDPTPMSKDWKWTDECMRKLTGPMKLDMLTFNHADEIMHKEAGLEKCEKKVFRLPWGPSESISDPKMKQFAEQGRAQWRKALDRMVEVALTGESEEKKKETWEELNGNLTPKEGMWFPFVAVWGRRPE